MSREARPIVDAWIEEGRKHPEGGKEFTDAVDKRVQEIKKQSIEEKKQGHLRYRGNMLWAGLSTQEEFDAERMEALEHYRSGNFFLERIGRYRSVDVPLTMTILNLRQQWVKEYDIKTAPEFMLLDAAMISYFHLTRLNELINNAMSSIEWDIFALDVPRFESYYGYKTEKESRFMAEGLARNLQEVLQPVLEQYNRMFIRNLKALRDLKRGNIQLNIGNVGQMNIGDKQINIEKESGNDPQSTL